MVGLASIPAGILDARVDEAMIARFASASGVLRSPLPVIGTGMIGAIPRLKVGSLRRLA